jgi:RNA polymerase sigma factor (sigma-70 family)
MAGDREAGFEALYRAEYAGMSRLAFLMLQSVEAAEEATHDGFIRVYERWSKLDEPGAYLRTCVVNRCRDLQRRGRLERERRQEQGASYEDLGARELLDVLDTLPFKQRAAVVLRFYEGMTEEATARTLDIPVGTVKSSVSRALAQLREAVSR